MTANSAALIANSVKHVHKTVAKTVFIQNVTDTLGVVVNVKKTLKETHVTGVNVANMVMSVTETVLKVVCTGFVIEVSGIAQSGVLMVVTTLSAIKTARNIVIRSCVNEKQDCVYMAVLEVISAINANKNALVIVCSHVVINTMANVHMGVKPILKDRFARYALLVNTVIIVKEIVLSDVKIKNATRQTDNVHVVIILKA